MERFGRAMARVERALGAIASVLLLGLLALMTVEVVARYVFGRSTLVADEYGGYAMAWMTMLGAVHLLRADRHLTMTWVLDRMSPAGRNAAGLLAALVGLGISIVFLYATATLVWTSWRFHTRSIQPSATPLGWPQLVLPLGYLLLCVAYLEEILRRLLGYAPRRLEDVSEGIS